MKFLVMLGVLVSSAALADTPHEVPVRFASVKAKIFKINVERNGNGQISIGSTQICRFDGAAPVYDVREKNNWLYRYDATGSCDSTMNGEKVKIYVYAALALSGHGSGEDGYKKMATASLNVTRDDDSSMNLMELRNSFGSRDLRQASFLTNIDPDFWNSKTSSEFFSAEIELMDVGQ